MEPAPLNTRSPHCPYLWSGYMHPDARRITEELSRLWLAPEPPPETYSLAELLAGVWKRQLPE